MTLRLTTKNGRTIDGKDIYKFRDNIRLFPELEGVSILVDKSDVNRPNSRKIDWSNRDFWTDTAKDVPIIIVHDQSSSRSTEWACHDRLYAIHDYRETITYTVISQAQERVCHYATNHKHYTGGFQPIRVFGHKKTFELSAGLITYEQYLEDIWIMKKIDTRRVKKDKLEDRVYEIKNKDKVLHPEYNSPLTETGAENILKQLGCFGKKNVSVRVKSKRGKGPIFDTTWFPCSSNNFTECIKTQLDTVSNGKYKDRTFDNPFKHPERPGPDSGYLRGWGVFDYDIDVKTNLGWGVTIVKPRLTICYHQNVLGVAIRWHSEKFEESSTILNSYRSMYPSKKKQES